jgi:hypothetical protein
MKNSATQLFQKFFAHFFIVLLLFQTIGCTYFKVKTLTSDFITINNIGKIHKQFIVHTDQGIYAMKDLEAKDLELKGTLSKIDHAYYNKTRTDRYKKHEKNILNEVHIYLTETNSDINTGPITIPMSSVKEIRIIDKDSGKSTGYTLLATLGVAAGAFALFMIIVALTKSSCPYIYVNDGEGFVFEGEIFGGAISKNLQRDDYMPLPSIKPSSGEYTIRISNELKERQYTDIAELLVVSHPQDSKVLLDKNGNPHLISNELPPISAISNSKQSLLQSLSKKDKGVYMFNDEEHSTNSIQLQFDKPANTNSAKLVLNGKNTLWFDYLFGEFLSKFGMTYNDWMKKQEERATDDRIDIIRQSDIPLSIYLKKGTEWTLVDYIHTVGPMANRDLVVPIDLKGHNQPKLELKIETGFMFWEVDYAAIDYTDNQSLDIEVIKPAEAFGSHNQNWLNSLQKKDGKYMSQLEVGDVTEIKYLATQAPADLTQSVFLHTSGYYELIRDFKGLPRFTELNKFKIPGHFSDFSRTRYLEVLDKKAS